jgi:Ca2+-transporting ATPase
MDDLGEKLSWMSLSVIAVIFLLGVWNGHKWFNMFVLGVSMAVAAIPEGLPIVTTVTLALGVIRMAERNAIVKKLPSVETLGCTNIICSDKTGTLTMNQMTVKKIWTIGDKSGIIDVSGIALDTNGEFSRNGQVLDLNKEHNLNKLLDSGVLCNNAQIMEGKLIGDATEGSLIVAGAKAKKNGEYLSNFVKKEEIAFSSKTKWMATKVETKKTSEVYYYVKGAIESVLPKCDTIYSNGDFKPIKDDMLEQMNNTANQIASEGMRVLALGFGKDHNKLAFVGLVGILDPPRPNVKTAIKSLREHGVRTIMITGDAKATAISIGKELGIWTNDFNVAISPSDIEEDMSKTDLSRVSIFYRMTPSHKSIIVEALQKQGNIVGMLGDGVNDAIALKLADIGIAMGSGTDVCKEDSKMVDDNFGTILADRGESIFSGIKKYLDSKSLQVFLLSQ